MKKFGFTTVVASSLIAGALGFAGLAQADTGHNDWVNQIQPTVNIPQVDTTVHQLTHSRTKERGTRYGCPFSFSHVERQHLVDRPEDALLADRPRGAELLGPQAHPQFLDLPRDIPDVGAAARDGDSATTSSS